jgi:glycosyltransferase involved in cell wall biosynthesis
MKVIINALGYVGQSGGAGGAGVFVQYLVSQLAESCAVDVLIPPDSKSFDFKPKGVRFIELPYLSPETLRHLREGPTVVVDPFGGLPCRNFPDDIGLCTVIHDLMHLERPYFFPLREREERSNSFALGVHRADAVIVFSQDQARAVKRYFPGTLPVVIPHLPYMTLRGQSASSQERQLPQGLKNFVLFAAVRWPHKNHKTVVEAFASYIQRTGSALQLVMCGGACAESRFSYAPSNDTHSSQIIDLGRVDDGTLDSLFHHAQAVLFPTLYEGFGIPVLEAAYLGKMIVGSSLDVFDEILGPSNYRRVVDPLCHARWMDAFADIEGPARQAFEVASRSIREKVDVPGFINKFTGVLKGCADRYTHPAFYPLHQFPSGDHPTSVLLGSLNFSDIYGSSTPDAGARYVVLGAKPAAHTSTIFRNSTLDVDRRKCLRATYDIGANANESLGTLQFSAWVRLHGEPDIDALLWAVNDQNVVDFLPQLRGGDWRLVRANIPKAGYIDFRGQRAGVNEVANFELEIHDPLILRLLPPLTPREEPLKRSLTILVSTLGSAIPLSSIVKEAEEFNRRLPLAASGVSWIILATAKALDAKFSVATLPANVRIQTVPSETLSRDAATSLLSPYQPIDHLLLLEASDLRALVSEAGIGAITSLFSAAPNRRELVLDIAPHSHGLWRAEERGKFLEIRSRAGEPLPPLDPLVIDTIITAPTAETRPRFAIIETDRTSTLSHHSTVSTLFLDGAEFLGFQRVLGLNRSSELGAKDDIETWAGFSSQVYDVGAAETFCLELGQFIEAVGLGSDDIVFLHSLSPQIVLGSARFIASNPELSPTFVMRFFSTAEAMRGHKLSYVSILKSIASVAAVRRKMQFFCESLNLQDYYESQIGIPFPLLFNPEHPSLANVRKSLWFDQNLGGGKAPTLAFFGEAREEKGFDEIPGILSDLLQSDVMSNHRFLIQTGSNLGNDTAKIARAKKALMALKAKYPGRIRTFESVETPEQFYFLMKHTTGVIAPYSVSAYERRGTGVTLEALQMGLVVFAWAKTDLFATFRSTGRVIGVEDHSSFAQTIIEYFSASQTTAFGEGPIPLSQTPKDVCERMLSLVALGANMASKPAHPPVVWVGNDTFGEGCSVVYSSQKRAFSELDRDCYELFVPWPDPNWSGVDSGAYDAKIYGFDTGYEGSGLAWVAQPVFTPALHSVLAEIQNQGPTYKRLRTLNEHFKLPASFQRMATNSRIGTIILNYVHLHPVIEALGSTDRIVCETHDIVSYQHAVRRGDEVSFSEKIDEFSDMMKLPKIIAISAEEQREMAGVCSGSQVFWRIPPYIPEPIQIEETGSASLLDINALLALGGVPNDVALPTVEMLAVYCVRDDLNSLFHLDTATGRAAFFRWWFFFGQFETDSEIKLNRRQFQWLVGMANETTEPDWRGMLTLIASFRPDLRAVFGSDEKADFRAMANWAHTHAEREYGISPIDLLKRGLEEFRGLRSGALKRASAALKATLEADPHVPGRDWEELGPLLERIADVDRVDMAIIGSAHPANIVSARWFVENVFLKYFATKGRNLFVVGNLCTHLQDYSHRNLFLLGRCKRIEPMLAAARACPLPIVFGSGSPIKVIPAMVVNGAVTITHHIDRAFNLSGYDIPAFSEPREFATDLMALLTDDAFRAIRVARARKYAEENLTLDGYVKFWEKLLA